MFFNFRLLLKIIGYSFGVISTALLIGAAIAYFHRRYFVATAVRCEGTVTKLVESHSNDMGTVYHPVFVFRDSQGREHEVYSSGGSYPPAYKVGEKVTVLYNAEQPDNACLNGFCDVWILPFLLALIGGVQFIVAIISLCILRYVWKPGQKPSRSNTSS